MQWSVPLKLDVIIDYVDNAGARSKRPADIHKADYYETSGSAPRIRLHARGPRTYYLHKIFSFTDTSTGEIHEDAAGVIAFLASALARQGLPQPPGWPVWGTIPFNTSDFGINFGPDGMAEGWFFGVSTAFRAALGITRHPTAKGWLRRVPPVLSFDAGDHFHAPARPREAWDRQSLWMTWTIQVMTDFGDQGLCIALRKWTDGAMGDPVFIALTQEQLEAALRYGPERLQGLPTQTEPFRAWPDGE